MSKRPKEISDESVRRPITFPTYACGEIPADFRTNVALLAELCEEHEDLFVELNDLDEGSLDIEIISFLDAAGFFDGMGTFVGGIGKDFIKIVLSKFVDETGAISRAKLSRAKESQKMFSNVLRKLVINSYKSRPLFATLMLQALAGSVVADCQSISMMPEDIKEMFRKRNGLNPSDAFIEQKLMLLALNGANNNNLGSNVQSMISSQFYGREIELQGTRVSDEDAAKFKSEADAMFKEIRFFDLKPGKVKLDINPQPEFKCKESMTLNISEETYPFILMDGSIMLQLPHMQGKRIEVKFSVSRITGELCFDGSFLSSLKEVMESYGAQNFYELLRKVIFNGITDAYLRGDIKEDLEEDEDDEAVIDETTEDIASELEEVIPDIVQTPEDQNEEEVRKEILGSARLRGYSWKKIHRAIARFDVSLDRVNKHTVYVRETNEGPRSAAFSTNHRKAPNPHILYRVLKTLGIPIEEFLECI